MSQNFNEIMDYAIKRCEGKYVDDGASKECFYLIYPLTHVQLIHKVPFFTLPFNALWQLFFKFGKELVFG